MISPREEVVSTGTIGTAGARLLYSTVRAVAIGHRFPPPSGTSGWDESTTAGVAHDFLAGARGTKRLADITIRSVDSRSFERLLEAAVVNFLRDVARRTDFGKLVVRIKEVLRSNESTYASAGSARDRWMLVDGQPIPSSASPESLRSAISGVEVVVPKWTSSRRDTPLADEASFKRLINAVLAQAAGSLTAVDLAHALASRLDLRRAPLSIELDVREGVAEPAAREGDPAGATVARLHASAIFDSLSDRERVIIATLGLSIRDVALQIGMGKSQTGLIRQRLFDRLAHEFDDAASAEPTSVVLTSLCSDWTDGRTTLPGATS